MSLSRRSILAAQLQGLTAASFVGAAMPAQAAAAASGGTVRTLEDFGANGDYDFRRGTGSDDTAAIQAALDWAFGGGATPARAIAVGAANYLCGPITTYPYTTLIGSGRQTSNFVCRPGTTGAWWSDRGNGAQKLMLSGLAWYGRKESAITHIGRFGYEGTQFGTEGILDGLWLRDAPRGTALAVNGNVGILRDLTLQACATALEVRGNANQIDNVICMEPVQTGADIAGCFVRGLHVEATGNGGIPLIMNGDCRVRDLMISTARGTRFDHLIRVDNSNYDEWAIEGVHLLGTDGAVTRGMIRVGTRYVGGVDASRFTGSTHLARLSVHGSDLRVAGQSWRAFTLEIARRDNALRHRTGALGAPGQAGESAIIGADAEFTKTPFGAPNDLRFAGGGRIIGQDRSRFVLDLLVEQGSPANRLHATIERSSAGRPLTVAGSAELQTGRRFTLQFFDAIGGAPFSLDDLPEGGFIRVACCGFA